MPTVREVQTITKNDVGVVNAADLVKQVEPQGGIATIANGESLLKQLTSGGITNYENTGENPNSTYIFNASKTAGNWPTQQAVGLDDREYGLMESGNMVKCTPMKYWVLFSSGFMTNMTEGGVILESYTDMKIQKENVFQHYVAALLVDLNGRIVPARGEFRRTVSSTIATAVSAIEQAADPNWLKMSEAHKIAAQYQFPWGRVICEAKVVPAISKSGPRAGKTYMKSAVVARPATVEELTRLQQALSDEKFLGKLKMVLDAYQQKVTILTAQASEATNVRS